MAKPTNMVCLDYCLFAYYTHSLSRHWKNSGLVLLGFIRKQLSRGSKPVSSLPPWSLHQLGSWGSSPVCILVLSSFSDERWFGSVSQTYAFLLELFLGHSVSSRPLKTWDMQQPRIKEPRQMETPAPDQSFQRTCVIFMRNGGMSLPRSGRTPDSWIAETVSKTASDNSESPSYLASCSPPGGATGILWRPRTEIVYQMPQRCL